MDLLAPRVSEHFKSDVERHKGTQIASHHRKGQGMAARIKPAGQTREERDRISLGRIESFMDAQISKELHCPSCKGKFEIKEITSQAVNLIRARYDKLRPSLTAVEQTNIDPAVNLDPARAREMLLQALISDPSLLSEAAAKVAKGTQTPIQSVNKAA